MRWEQTLQLTRPLRSVQLVVAPSDAAAAARREPPVSREAPLDPEPDQNPSQVALLLERLAESLQARRQTHQQGLQKVQIAAVEIALVVAERMFLKASSEGQLELERLVAEGLALLHTTDSAVVQLHPEDAAQLRPHLASLSSNELTLVENPRMERGTCQLADGDVGIGFDGPRQLQELRMSILQGLTDADASR